MNHLTHQNLSLTDFIQMMTGIGLFLPRKVHGAISIAQEQCFEFREGIEWTIAQPNIFPEPEPFTNQETGTTQPHNIFPSLPPELIPKILNNLSLRDLLTLETSSRGVKAFLSLPTLNTFWLQQCIKRRWRGPYLQGTAAVEIPENTNWRQYVQSCIKSPHVLNWDRIQKVLKYFDEAIRLWVTDVDSSDAE